MKQACIVQGHVMRTSGEPLGKAEVTLARAEIRPPVSYVAVSSADGGFVLNDIEPGQYRLSVTRNGYVNETPDKELFGGGSLLTLLPGRPVQGIVIRMAPQAAISGRITDEDGEGVPDIHVTLLREMTGTGSKTWMPVSGQIRTTNDLGDFRIPQLLPGRYLLCTNSDRHMRHGMGHGTRIGPSQQDTWPTCYFPGVTDQEQAQPIAIAEGQHLQGYDLQMKKVRAFRIRGHVELPPDAGPRSLHLMLVPYPLPGHGIAGSVGGALSQPADFELGAVLPGSYDLIAQCHLAQRGRSVHTRVDVTDHDVEGLVVTFASGFAIEGMVRAADDSARLNPASVHVSLRPEEPTMQFGGASAEPSGAFTLHDVPPGRYEVWVHLHPEDGYVESVQYAGRDSLNDWIEIGPEGAAGRLEVIVAFDGGEVTGILQDAGGMPRPDRSVHLLNDPPRFDRPRLARSDQDGRFWFRHIRPGNYWLFAVDAVQPVFSLEDRWEAHEGTACKVAVPGNGREEVVIRLPR